MELREHLQNWIDEKTSEPEYQSYFLVDFVLTGNRLEVFLDGDKGIDLDVCRAFSRYLELHLDQTGIIGGEYTLEVSSPGVTRPLTLARQYPKHLGRQLEVKVKDAETLTGTLKAADEDMIMLEVTVGKGKNKIQETHELPYDAFSDAKVLISFK